MTDIWGDAWISEDGVYRYQLRRAWGDSWTEQICWVMLNPSTADASTDDPTIRRCIGFSNAWGYSGLVVVNLWAFRVTKPADLLLAHDPAGRENNRAITQALACSSAAVVAWGSKADDMSKAGRARFNVEGAAAKLGVPVFCLGKTKTGQPRHPLYMPNETSLIAF